MMTVPATGLRRLIEAALEEDRWTTDYTSLATIPAGRRAVGIITARQGLRLCGLEVIEAVFERGDPALACSPLAAEGDDLEAGSPLARVSGPARSLLGLERTALNFFGRLCGVATRTRDWCAELRRAWEALPPGERRPAPPRLTDTRKTTPGWRELEKYAVRVGGGANHRFDLAGGILIKDNHLAACGGPAAALRAARSQAPHGLRLEIEVTDLSELDEALDNGADVCLLDNMDGVTLAEAIRRCRARGVTSEVSGGVAFESLGALAALGPDIISAGALTHSAPSADVALDLSHDSSPV